MNIPGTNEKYGDFIFTPNPPTWSRVKRAEGELRVPSLVSKKRDLEAQKSVSFHTGEHAGHLIGTQFGAPGGLENLSLQNPNMNTYAPKALQEALKGHGASYLEMELDWALKLERGIRIKVIVEDHFRPKETRPFYRTVQWSEKLPGHAWDSMPERIFGNFGSPQAEAAKHKW